MAVQYGLLQLSVIIRWEDRGIANGVNPQKFRKRIAKKITSMHGMNPLRSRP